MITVSFSNGPFEHARPNCLEVRSSSPSSLSTTSRATSTASKACSPATCSDDGDQKGLAVVIGASDSIASGSKEGIDGTPPESSLYSAFETSLDQIDLKDGILSEGCTTVMRSVITIQDISTLADYASDDGDASRYLPPASHSYRITTDVYKIPDSRTNKVRTPRRHRPNPFIPSAASKRSFVAISDHESDACDAEQASDRAAKKKMLSRGIIDAVEIIGMEEQVHDPPAISTSGKSIDAPSCEQGLEIQNVQAPTTPDGAEQDGNSLLDKESDLGLVPSPAATTSSTTDTLTTSLLSILDGLPIANSPKFQASAKFQSRTSPGEYVDHCLSDYTISGPWSRLNINRYGDDVTMIGDDVLGGDLMDIEVESDDTQHCCDPVFTHLDSELATYFYTSSDCEDEIMSDA